MKLNLNDVNEEDRGVIAPCGIICLGCDVHLQESLQAAKTIIKIWEGFNLPDVAVLVGLKAQEVCNTLDTLGEYVVRREKAGPCPGCFKAGGPSAMCSIAKCVKSRGYWTCAECDDLTRNLKSLALILIPVLLQCLWVLDEKLPLSYAGDIAQITSKT